MKNNIIVVCPFVAGVHSAGMEALKKEFKQLTTEEIKRRDSLNMDFTKPFHHVRVNKTGIRYDGEKTGGEVDLLEEL